MIASNWMKWAVTGALAAAFPAMAVAHTHKTASPAMTASSTSTTAKTYSVHHHKSHKLSTKRLGDQAAQQRPQGQFAAQQEP